jgi:hypothetical protein
LASSARRACTLYTDMHDEDATIATDEGLQPPQAPSDRKIAAWVILKVNSDNNQPFLGNYLPFVYHCLSETEATVVSTADLKVAMMQSFSIDLPQAVLQQLLEHARQAGKVSYQHHVYEIVKEELQDCSLKRSTDQHVRGYRRLIQSVVEFAATNYALDWPHTEVEDSFMGYLDGFSLAILAGALADEDVPAPAQPNPDPDLEREYVLHRFIMHINDSDPHLFKFLENIVTGRILSDALYLEPEMPEDKRNLEGVEVYFDGRSLLRMLGHSGPEIQAPYTELLEMLKRQNAAIRCFDHDVVQARRILETTARQVSVGDSSMGPDGDVLSYLVRQGSTSVQIELLAEHLDSALKELGLTAVSEPACSETFTPEEERMEEALRSFIDGSDPCTGERAFQSIAAIHRLRDGQFHRELSGCRAVLVTYDHKLSTLARRLEEKKDGQMIPHCVHHRAFTIMVWTREAIRSPTLTRERIIADAYAAMKPSAALLDTYTLEIKAQKVLKGLSDADVWFLRFSRESSEALMDITRGDPHAFTEGTLGQILDHARETERANLQSQLKATQAELSELVASVAHSRERVLGFCQGVASTIAGTVFVGLVLALTLGVVLGPHGIINKELIPAPIQLFCILVATAAGIWSSVHRGSLTSLRSKLERWLNDHMSSALLAALALPELAADEPPEDAPQS